MTRPLDAFASEPLGEIGIYDQPPINVYDLARRLGVTEIRTAPLVEDGRLEVSHNQVRIRLRSGLSPARRRFTIAHELAHLLIENRPEMAKRVRVPTTGIERRCDEMAAAILLPYSWVMDNYSHSTASMATVRDLADAAHVSMGAAVVRLKEVLGWHYSLLRWRRDTERWRFVAGAGVPKPFFGKIQSAPTTTATLEALLSQQGRDHVTVLPVSVRSAVRLLRAEVSLRGNTSIALTDLLQSDRVVAR